MVLSILASRQLVAISSSRQVACALLKNSSNGTCLLRGVERESHAKAKERGACTCS